MKAFIALYENETPFDFRVLDPDHPESSPVGGAVPFLLGRK
jgi:hypothetical protein